MVVAALTVLRRAVGFGFAKPSTDMLYSVVTPEEKYKAKNAIDTAIYRGGDVVGVGGGPVADDLAVDARPASLRVFQLF